jgi:hypothetical protein
MASQHRSIDRWFWRFSPGAFMRRCRRLLRYLPRGKAHMRVRRSLPARAVESLWRFVSSGAALRVVGSARRNTVAVDLNTRNSICRGLENLSRGMPGISLWSPSKT